MKKITFDYGEKTKSLKHQEWVIKFITGNKPVALFDEQGLGKTKIVINSLCIDIKNHLIDGALIVCKKTLITTWIKEIMKHSNLYGMELSGNKYERKKYFSTFAHFYIIGYESFVQELDYVRQFLSIRKLALVLDESQKIKNPYAKVTEAILSVKNLSRKRIIITGTPISNRPEDLWSQFYFLDDGERLGRDFNDFKNQYGIDISMGKHEIDEEILLELRNKISDISIRRRKEDIPDLKIPPKNPTIDEYVVLTNKQKRMYDDLRKNLVLEIKNMNGQFIVDHSSNILKKLLRLIQITSNPFLLDKSFTEEPVKFKKLDILIDKIIKRNEKVIVWTIFVDNVLILKRRYSALGSLTLYGGMKRKEKDRTVEKFQENPEFKVLIANPSVAGVGLTLTASNNAIYLDRNFNMGDYLQSQDRIHRIGQKKRCNIIRILARNTIDEYIDDILEKKQDVAKYVQGDSNVIRKEEEFLSKEELIRILGNE